MVRIENVLYCDGCGVEIVLAPIVVRKKHFCCRECAQGRVCQCGERMEVDEERRGSQHAQGAVSYTE